MQAKLPATECTVVKYTTKNDVNGNPRRVYMVYHQGTTVAAIDEDFEGSSALDRLWGREVGRVLREREAWPEIEVSPSQYKRLLKWGKKSDLTAV